MKKILTLGALVFTVAYGAAGFTQEVDPELAEACHGDIGLTDYVVQAAGASGALASDMFSSEEIDQIQIVLSDEALSDSSVKDKLTAVMDACSEGRILLERFGSMTTAG